MAKLNVVIPAVDVEIDGVKYRKVDRKAEVGDAIKITDNGGIGDVVEGGFYAVAEVDSWDDPQIIDEAGDELDCHGMGYEVYEKVEQSAQQYREVKRHAEVGERIRIVELWPSESRYRVGAEFVVDKVRSSDGYVWVRSLGEKVIALSEYVVLEPIEPAQPKRLAVGDYAKVIEDIGDNYEVGAIIRIVEDDGSDIPYKGVYADGTCPKAWLYESEVEPATEAEFLAQKRFNVGEYVKVTDSSGAGEARLGDIGVVIDDNWGGGPINDPLIIQIKTLDGREYGMFASRFARVTEDEVAAAKQAVKVGEFADGGYAAVTDVAKSISLAGFQNGDYVTVSTATPGAYVLIVKTLRGNVGYCNADALRKVSKEEYEAATDPRSKFGMGDFAKVIRSVDEFRVGDIVKITGDKSNSDAFAYDFKVDKTTRGGYGYINANNIEKVSAEEVAEIERKALLAQFKAGDSVKFVVPEGAPAKFGRASVSFGEIGTIDCVEEHLVRVTFPSFGPGFMADPTELTKTSAEDIEVAKWATIGRKVNEFKKGDIVKCIGLAAETAGYGEVLADPTANRVKVRYYSHFGICTEPFDIITLIVPVEQRFDREEKAAA